MTTAKQEGLAATFGDACLIDGARTPFADYNGALASVSPIDLGIKAARAAFAKTGAAPDDVGTVIAGNMAQASFDAFMLPRHIGLYSGVPQKTPAAYGAARVRHRNRSAGAGLDAVSLGRAELALCVGTEHEPQSGCVLHQPWRLSHGSGRVQGFSLGGVARSGLRHRHGRHRRESGAALSDHAARGRRLCGTIVRAGA